RGCASSAGDPLFCATPSVGEPRPCMPADEQRIEHAAMLALRSRESGAGLHDPAKSIILCDIYCLDQAEERSENKLPYVKTTGSAHLCIFGKK
ncbi:MAG: hypothetical protein SPJ86_04615, partial [Eubacteriales bacterium]|nr:hypothetical protein [Eubacteriales bacterium]